MIETARMRSAIRRWDDAGLQLASRCRKPWLSALVVPYTRLGNLGLLWLMLGMMVDQSEKIAKILITTVVVTELIKRIARRRRPAFERLERLIGFQRTTSFPSGHAASAAAAAIALSVFHPALLPLWLALALAMAASRVYVGVHYPSDAAAGLAIGIVLGTIAMGGLAAIL
jgi:undecaprenyl-diphosphatase